MFNAYTLQTMGLLQKVACDDPKHLQRADFSGIFNIHSFIKQNIKSLNIQKTFRTLTAHIQKVQIHLDKAFK